MADICKLHDLGAKLLLQTIALITAATRSTNLELQPSKVQIWKASCQDRIPLSYKTRSHSHSAAWGGHQQIHGDIEPGPVVLGKQASMEKKHNVSRIAFSLADLNAGL